MCSEKLKAKNVKLRLKINNKETISLNKNVRDKVENQNPKSKTKLKGRTYQYSIEIIEYIDTLPLDISTQAISKQLLRSATSIGSNIIDAQASSSKKDFTKFFIYSLKSANESLYWLGLLKDARKVHNNQLEYLLNETKELANILVSSILTLKGKNKF